MENVLNYQSGMVEKASDFFKKMNVAAEMMQSPPKVKTGQTPSDIVYRKHRTKLLHYKSDTAPVKSTPILFVYALVNKYYILDLIPGKSIIEMMVKAGLDVYAIDWGEPTEVDKKRGLDDYLNIYLDKAVDYIRKTSGSDKITILGYCMGGTMSLMYTALHPEKVKNIVLMASPFDFSSDEGMLYQWTRDFPLDELIELFDNCPGWYLNSVFGVMKPMDRLDKVVNFYKNMDKEKFREMFFAMEKWNADSPSVPGKAYLEFLQGGFQQNLMIQNKFEIDGKPVDFKKVKCPFLNLVAEKDTLVPASSSLGIGDHIKSKDQLTLTCNTGHVGLAVSGKVYKTFWPQAVEWIKERS